MHVLKQKKQTNGNLIYLVLFKIACDKIAGYYQKKIFHRNGPQKIKPRLTPDTWRISLLVSICEENLNNIDSVIYNEVTNFGIKRNAEDLLKHSETTFSNCW